jgi:transposase
MNKNPEHRRTRLTSWSKTSAARPASTYSAEEKIRIVLEGLRGEESIAVLCRREGIADEPVLQLVEGVPRSRQEAAGG